MLMCPPCRYPTVADTCPCRTSPVSMAMSFPMLRVRRRFGGRFRVAILFSFSLIQRRFLDATRPSLSPPPRKNVLGDDERAPLAPEPYVSLAPRRNDAFYPDTTSPRDSHLPAPTPTFHPNPPQPDDESPARGARPHRVPRRRLRAPDALRVDVQPRTQAPARQGASAGGPHGLQRRLNLRLHQGRRRQRRVLVRLRLRDRQVLGARVRAHPRRRRARR